MVTQLHIHVHILFSHIIMLHHKWLDIVPSATQQKLIANPFQRQQFASIVLVVTREGVTNNTCISPNRLVYGRYLLTGSFSPHFIFYFILFIYLFIYFRAVPVACGGSQTRGLIRAKAAGLHHSHSSDKEKLFFLIVISPIQFFFPTVQHGDPVTHTCIHSFFSHYHAPSS